MIIKCVKKNVSSIYSIFLLYFFKIYIFLLVCLLCISNKLPLSYFFFAFPYPQSFEIKLSYHLQSGSINEITLYVITLNPTYHKGLFSQTQLKSSDAIKKFKVQSIIILNLLIIITDSPHSISNNFNSYQERYLSVQRKFKINIHLSFREIEIQYSPLFQH